MIRQLPGGKFPRPSGTTYTIVNKYRLPLDIVLFLTRIWNFVSPHTHERTLVISPPVVTQRPQAGT